MNTEVLNECIKIVSDLKAKGIILNEIGIFDKRATAEWKRLNNNKELVPFTVEELSYEWRLLTLIKAIRIIPFLVKTTTRKFLVGSYSLKHILERTFYVEHSGSYMSNGEAILAMLFLKYKYHLSEDGNWNCSFSCIYAKNDYIDGLSTNESRPSFLKF